MTEANTSWWTLLRNRMRGMLPFASGVVAALLALFAYSFLFPKNQMSEREVNEAIANALASATPRPAFSAQVWPIIQSSLVVVETDGGDPSTTADDSIGSGVIVNEGGQILTCLHVVRGSGRITVIFADGTSSSAVVALAQPENDIAVLQSESMPAQWAPATLGNPGAMRVGDEAFVVGNPFGLYGSMSAGVISGFNRTFHPKGSDRVIEGLIQFDAAANPGNSGGPLLNRDGHVIGIVTGIVNPTTETFFVGIGFAVPIGTATGGMGSPPY